MECVKYWSVPATISILLSRSFFPAPILVEVVRHERRNTHANKKGDSRGAQNLHKIDDHTGGINQYSTIRAALPCAQYTHCGLIARHTAHSGRCGCVRARNLLSELYGEREYISEAIITLTTLTI